MNARLRATWLAAVLVVAFGLVMVVQPTGYMTLTPGPTLDLLGSNGSTPWVVVPGHKTYDDKGQLRMLTVYEQPQSQKLSLPAALANWFQDDTSVYPVSVWYPPNSSDSSNNQQAALQMTSAEDSAKAAALQALGIKVPTRDTVMIGSVDPNGPSNRKIQAGDVLTSVDGKAITSAATAIAIIKQHHPGDVLQVGLKRGKKDLTVAIKTVAKGTSGALATQPRIGVGLGDAQQFQFPFKININMPDNIGGGSAGMMMALTIYDLLTPGSLTGGHVIAGTGTIGQGPGQGLDAVGPIGGIDQKIRGAQRDGAQLFLAPATNCDEVRNANYDHKTMRIVKVNTLQDAIAAIKAWTANPNASLPGCS